MRPRPATKPHNKRVTVSLTPVLFLPIPIGMDRNQKTLLIVDDMEMNRTLLSRQLAQAGYQILVAGSGQEALDQVKSHPVDLVLLDVVMKDLDGLTVLKTLRQSYSLLGLPIIMVTAQSESAQIAGALHQGANDYLIKPVDIQVALARIQTHLTVKELEEKLDEQRSRAVGSAKMAAIGEMAGGIAHEINNPLAIICATASVLESIIRNYDPSQQKEALSLIQRVEKTGYRIARIIQSLRQFSRSAEADEWKECIVKDFINEALLLCDPRLKNGNIHLEYEPVEGSANFLKVKGRAVELAQALYYLLSNACDAVSKLPERWVRIRVTQETGKIVIRVEDSGAGIPSDISEKIFQPFFTTKDVEKGTGLGLTLASKTLKSHQGSLVLDQTRTNTCFVLTLPVSDQK